MDLVATCPDSGLPNKGNYPSLRSTDLPHCALSSSTYLIAWFLPACWNRTDLPVGPADFYHSHRYPLGSQPHLEQADRDRFGRGGCHPLCSLIGLPATFLTFGLNPIACITHG